MPAMSQYVWEKSKDGEATSELIVVAALISAGNMRLALGPTVDDRQTRTRLAGCELADLSVGSAVYVGV